MIKKLVGVFVCLMMLGSACVVLAGGPVVTQAPICYPPKAPCGPGGVPGVPGAPGAGAQYWGDAPFPGLCGGVVALPFLVVGSLLGGNTAGPYGPAPYGPGPYVQGQVQCGPPPQACGPAAPISYNCPPPAYAPRGCAPAPPQACGPYGGQYAGGSSFLGGLPCLELCSSLLGSVSGGMNFLY